MEAHKFYELERLLEEFFIYTKSFRISNPFPMNQTEKMLEVVRDEILSYEIEKSNKIIQDIQNIEK